MSFGVSRILEKLDSSSIPDTCYFEAQSEGILHRFIG